jgi:hypothetical protein
VLGLPLLPPELDLAAGKLTIFVSYSRANYPLAAELCRFLKSKGFEVVTDNELSPEEPIDRAMESLISRSDAMLALIADELGRWVLNEIFEAQKQQVPVISVLLGKRGWPPSICRKSNDAEDRKSSRSAGSYKSG